MKELRRLDRALILILVPIWVACFALFTAERLAGRPNKPPWLVAATSADPEYPEIVRYRPGTEVEAGAPTPGDIVLRIGERDMRGRGGLAATVYSLSQADADGRVRVRVASHGQPPRDTFITLLPEEQPWRIAVLAVGFAGTALLLVLRAPRSRVAQTFLPAALVWSLSLLQFQGPVEGLTLTYIGLRVVVGCLWAPLFLRSALYFPEDVGHRLRREPRWPWLFAALGPTWTGMWFGWPLPLELSMRLNPALGGTLIATLLFVLTRNVWRAGPSGRRQAKWVLLGHYVGVLPVLGGVVAAAVQPEWTWLWNWLLVTLVAIPISIWIAVTRSGFLDIDRLITATASYTLLLVALVAGGLTVLPQLTLAAARQFEVAPWQAQLTLAVLLAPLVVAGQRLVRPRLERVFFAERHALEDGFERLGRELGQCPDARSLLTRAGEELEILLRPACCVIYGRIGADFAPVYASGSAVSPHFDASGPLLTSLAGRTAAVDLEPERRGGSLAASPADRAGLGSLGAAVLVPVPRGSELSALVVLGTKRSGDVYTSTDLAHLAAVGASMGAGLSQVTDAELLREARDLQDRLRQYVPGSIATQLAKGEELAPGEREVTVLFIDIQGYASFTEGLPPNEIFAAVSAYTETVSRVVTKHEGTVVEFNGDGMMAVFGAPNSLPDKERRALAAGQELVTAVPALALGASGDAPPLQAGVGIASGPAYVGAIRSVDRAIWSALGNTTNRAARLQALTRELDVPLLADLPTVRAAGASGADFVYHPDVAIRGLREPRDLFSWTPLPPEAGSAL
ncbi:MAG: adenylate/guanylate cyclase domain-containing protein [Proteobacteria bacterium]|nr:adenylate/guanylate cyclase domain-containing protein [Pseudomonadota bacterium]